MRGNIAIMTVPVDAAAPIVEDFHQWYIPQIDPNRIHDKPVKRKMVIAVKSLMKYR